MKAGVTCFDSTESSSGPHGVDPYKGLSTYVQEPLVIGRRGCVHREI